MRMSLREKVPSSLGAKSTRRIKSNLIIEIFFWNQCKPPFWFIWFQISSNLEITAVLSSSSHTQACLRGMYLCWPEATALKGMEHWISFQEGAGVLWRVQGNIQTKSQSKVNDSATNQWNAIGIWPFRDWLINGLYILITNGLRNLSADYNTAAKDAEKCSRTRAHKCYFYFCSSPAPLGMRTLSHILCFILNLVTFVCFYL